jgi:hypothetical protein
VKGFKKCCISSAVNKNEDICCGMAGKRMGTLAMSVRKTKALTVKTETVTMIGKGR